MNLSLSQALIEGRLEDFVAQEEARGVQPISEAEFELTTSAVIKTPPQDDQTSGSPRPGDLPGK